MNSGGVVETSDVCLDCHTVIDRDVDSNHLLLWCFGKKKLARCWMLISLLSLSMFIQLEVCLRGDKRLTYYTLTVFVLRHYNPIAATVEQKKSRLMYWAPALECSWVSFNWCWCLLLIKRESEKKQPSGFESHGDSFQSHVWSKNNVTRGSSSPFLCVKALGDLRRIATSVAFLRLGLLIRATLCAHKYKESASR